MTRRAALTETPARASRDRSGEGIAALAGARTAEAIVPAIEPDDRHPGDEQFEKPLRPHESDGRLAPGRRILASAVSDSQSP